MRAYFPTVTSDWRSPTVISNGDFRLEISNRNFQLDGQDVLAMRAYFQQSPQRARMNESPARSIECVARAIEPPDAERPPFCTRACVAARLAVRQCARVSPDARVKRCAPARIRGIRGPGRAVSRDSDAAAAPGGGLNSGMISDAAGFASLDEKAPSVQRR